MDTVQNAVNALHFHSQSQVQRQSFPVEYVVNLVIQIGNHWAQICM